VLLVNHALPRHPIQTEQVHVRLTDAPAPTSSVLQRIDEDHANAKRAWREAGEREYLTAQDVERLEDASRIGREPIAWTYDAATIGLELALPPHAVAAVTLELASEAPGP
jgi:xylan 1,4-beta-xylosidase